MYNFLNFYSNFLFLLPISFMDTETTYQSYIQDVMSSCLAKPMTFNRNWEQVYKTFTCFANVKTCSLGLQVHASALNTCECTWTPMSEWEQPLNTRWVCMPTIEWALDTPWTPIECTWMPMSECEHLWVRMNAIESLLNVTHHGVIMRKFSFVSELNNPWTLWVHMNTFESVLNTPWMIVSAHECLWVSIEHPMNTCECTRMPMSEHWTCPECLRVCVNANEWVGSPEHPLSVHEWLWISLGRS
jgi:hypothetical protein